MKVTLVIPVLNEEQQLETSIRRLLNPGVMGWPQVRIPMKADTCSD